MKKYTQDVKEDSKRGSYKAIRVSSEVGSWGEGESVNQTLFENDIISIILYANFKN